METYRISSRLQQQEREYLIQTTNDATAGLVSTTVYVDGIQTETVHCPHPLEINPQELLALVKVTHGEKKEELEAMLQTYQQVVASGDPAMIYQLGTAFYYKCLCLEAAELFHSVASVDSEHHQAFNFLSMTNLELGRIDDALTAARHAVKLRPGYADYRNNLGEAYLAANNAEEAIAEFEQAITINMYYADAHLNLGLGRILRALPGGDRETTPKMMAAINECLDKAGMIYPDYKARTDFQEGLAAIKAGDFGQALNYLRRVREAKKTAHRREFASFYMRFVLFPSWVTERAINERIKYLESEVDQNPNYVDLKIELAQCYFEQSCHIWKRGVEQLSMAAEMNNSLPRVATALEEAKKTHDDMSCAVGRITGKE